MSWSCAKATEAELVARRAAAFLTWLRKHLVEGGLRPSVLGLFIQCSQGSVGLLIRWCHSSPFHKYS